MKNSFTKNIFAATLLGAISPLAMANSSGCESTWGQWCDVTSFLTSQEATAAGDPLAGGSASVEQRNFLRTN